MGHRSAVLVEQEIVDHLGVELGQQSVLENVAIAGLEVFVETVLGRLEPAPPQHRPVKIREGAGIVIPGIAQD